MEWILTQYATALIGAIQVNINPAYKSNELEYSLNKVGCKAIILSETYKAQNFVQILNEVCPELAASKPGQIKSARLPQLKSAILISKNKYE
jgi:fatty-acyl-CoA synthase